MEWALWAMVKKNIWKYTYFLFFSLLHSVFFLIDFFFLLCFFYPLIPHYYPPSFLVLLLLSILCNYLLFHALLLSLKRFHVHVLYPSTLHLSHLLHSSLQFVDRLSLFFMPLKYQPDYIYLRHVGIKKVYLFTFIQLMCLVVLWVIKSTDAAIVFPIMVSHGDLEP